jgi:hypothetical protein
VGALTLSGKIDHNLPLSTGAAAAPTLPMRVLENLLLFQKYGAGSLPWVLLLLVLPGVLARGRTTGWLVATRSRSPRRCRPSRRSPSTSTRIFSRSCRLFRVRRGRHARAA